MKTFRLIGTALVAALMTPLFISCSDDDDDGGKAPSKPVVTFDGKLLTSITSSGVSFDFTYDADGRCTRMSRDGSLVGSIDYKKGVLYDEDGAPMNIRFNGQGYISEISGSWNERDEDGDTSKGNGKFTFTYNGDGNLTKINISTTESAVIDGEKSTFKATASETFTWRNGNMSEARYEFKSDEDGEIESGYQNFNITYDSQVNKYRQMPYLMGTLVIIPGSPIAYISLPGLMGKGPANFPTNVAYELLDDGNIYNESMTSLVTLNTDGTIKTDLLNGYSTFNFSYTTHTPRSAAVSAASDDVVPFTVRNIFMGKRPMK